MGRDRKKGYKEAEELLGMRNTLIVLTVVMASWCTQRSDCTEAADR